MLVQISYYSKLFHHILCTRILVNKPSNSGKTPLLVASSNGHLPILQELLKDPRTDVNHQDSEGNTAAMIAITSGNCEAANLLIRCEKTKLEIKNDSEETALDMAKKDASVCNVMVKDMESREGRITEYDDGDDGVE